MSTKEITSYANDITYTTSIVAITCSCGLVYGLAKEFIAARREDHRTFYCPNGCSRWYPQKNQAEKLAEQLEAAQSLAQREARRRAQAEQEREAAHRQTRAYKGHATRLKNRVAAGKCPCCKQRFPDLAEHVAEQHPGYAGEVSA